MVRGKNADVSFAFSKPGLYAKIMSISYFLKRTALLLFVLLK